MAHRRTIQTNSTLSFYKKEAKKLLKQYRNGNPEALELFEGFHSQKEVLEEAKLSDSQLVLARHYGQKTWGHLIKIVESNEQFQLLEKAFQARNKKGISQLLNKYHILS
jgi:hypothetical protein